MVSEVKEPREATADTTSRTTTIKSSDVPQANSLDRIRQLVQAVEQGATQKKQIQAVTGLSARHADYYGQAARALGWVERAGEVYGLRQPATHLLETRVGSDEEREAFAQAIEACAVVHALAPDLLEDPGPSEEDLTARIEHATDLAHKTARRRAQALLTWRVRVVASRNDEPNDQDLVPLLIDEEGDAEGTGTADMTLSARVDAIEIDALKGIQHASLDLSGLTLLVGPHGAGKTSVRDAFRVLHAIGRGYSLPEIWGACWGAGGALAWSGIRGGPKELPYLGKDTFSISVQLAIPDGNEMRRADYQVAIRVPLDDLPRVHRERLVVEGRGAFVFDSHPEVAPPVQTPERLAVRLGRSSRTGTRGPTLLVNPKRPALSQLALHPAVRARSVTDAAARVLSAFRSLRFLDPRPVAMRRPSLPEQTVLGDHGENLSSVLHAVVRQPGGKETLQQGLRAFTDGHTRDIDFIADATGRLLLGFVDQHGMKLSAHSASEGLLRFMAWMGALLGPESPSFWFADDIDAGFDPLKIGLLLELLERQATATTRQVVATLRHQNALHTLDLGPEAIATAYAMIPHGWQVPQKLHATSVQAKTPRRTRRPREEDDPNERLPF